MRVSALVAYTAYTEDYRRADDYRGNTKDLVLLPGAGSGKK
ncbi:unnamed protein product [marine sediment metagenome]|uniref:Uncharacterized protein n=1 Tax=marine sediment metagenome TaxID=412755 RepID=X0Z1F1_9ZZZZ